MWYTPNMPKGRIHLGTVIGVTVVFILLGSGGYVFWEEVQRQLPNAHEFEQLTRTRYGQSRTTENEAKEKPTVDNDPSIGPADAPVTIIAFEDFECPYSGQVWRTEKQIMSEFEGKIRFVYRDFPISSAHPNALEAAEAAQCAHAQGKYWEMHDLLFIYQKNLSSDIIQEAARSLNLDMTEFTSCMDTDLYVDEVMADYQDAVNAGVSGTPTYFFNGIRVEGNLPIEVFRTAINYFL